MDLSVFFQPVPDIDYIPSLQPDARLGDQVIQHQAHFPDWQQADILILSAGAQERTRFADECRQELYSLSALTSNAAIADLGHLKPRELVEDLLEQLSFILSTLRQHRKTCLLLLDDPMLSLAQAYAYEGSETPMELVHIGSQLHLLDSEFLCDSQSFQHALLKDVPDWLFEFTQLGHQRYFVSHEQLAWLKRRHFAALRYGQLMNHVELAEPSLRTAHAVMADLSSVRASDAPGASVLSPGGFTAEEFCRLARYSSLGHHIGSFSVTGWNPDADRRRQTCRLAALTSWYFLDGCYQRFDDEPLPDRSNLTRYSVQLKAGISRIDFFLHPRSERWWMEVPFSDSIGEPSPKTRLVACTKEDYEFARHDDIPEKWWLTFHKLTGES